MLIGEMSGNHCQFHTSRYFVYFKYTPSSQPLSLAKNLSVALLVSQKITSTGRSQSMGM